MTGLIIGFIVGFVYASLGWIVLLTADKQSKMIRNYIMEYDSLFVVGLILWPVTLGMLIYDQRK